MLRIEAGLLMLDADFDSSRYAWNDAHRATPIELGWGWMVARPGARRPRLHRAQGARSASSRSGTSRWAMRGLVVDWQDYDRVYSEAGLIPPKDHTPVTEDMMVYDDERTPRRLRHELPVLADAAAPHRPRPRAPRPGRHRHDSSSSSSPSTTTTRQVAAHVARAAALQPRAQDGDAPDGTQGSMTPTTPSSSAAATTASSTAPTWPRPACAP